MRIIAGDLGDARVRALLATHRATVTAQTGRGSAHALDAFALDAPDIAFWTIWRGAELIGTGALRQYADGGTGGGHGEVKSMHVAEAARRTGAGSAMLRHIIAAARAERMTRLDLETGSWDYFRPAHAFYRAHGFTDGAPFGDYLADPNSVFMTLDLAGR